MLLTWVVLSSASVFDYIHAKESFDAEYQSALARVTCADTFIDGVLRGDEIVAQDIARHLFYGDQVICHITSPVKTVISQDVYDLSFLSDEIPYKVRVEKGFIFSL